MRVTRSHTFALPLGVATFHSVYKLTGFPCKALVHLARHRTVFSTDALLHTLFFRIEDVSFPEVEAVVGAATISHRHTGIPTQQVAFVTLAGLGAGPAASAHGGEAGAGGRAARGTQYVTTVSWARHCCGIG